MLHAILKSQLGCASKKKERWHPRSVSGVQHSHAVSNKAQRFGWQTHLFHADLHSEPNKNKFNESEIFFNRSSNLNLRKCIS